jgi:hypothetical protein
METQRTQLYLLEKIVLIIMKVAFVWIPHSLNFLMLTLDATNLWPAHSIKYYNHAHSSLILIDSIIKRQIPPICSHYRIVFN